MNLLQLLLGSLTSNNSLNSMSKKTGISTKLISKLVLYAVPLLIRYMTKNASSQSGAQSLLSALTQHTGTRSMAEQIDEVDEEDGGKIINHILGDDKDKVVTTLADETGLNGEEVTKGLGALAPALLTGLSAATNSASSNNSLDLGDLMGMFGGSQSSASSSLGLLGSLLGSVMQPAQEEKPQGLLGSLFGGKKEEEKPQSLLGGLFSAAQQQPQATPDADDLLASLLGGGQQQATSGMANLFGSLMGSGQQKASAFDGSDLLNALLALKK